MYVYASVNVCVCVWKRTNDSERLKQKRRESKSSEEGAFLCGKERDTKRAKNPQ